MVFYPSSFNLCQTFPIKRFKNRKITEMLCPPKQKKKNERMNECESEKQVLKLKKAAIFSKLNFELGKKNENSEENFCQKKWGQANETLACPKIKKLAKK